MRIGSDRVTRPALGKSCAVLVFGLRMIIVCRVGMIAGSSTIYFLQIDVTVHTRRDLFLVFFLFSIYLLTQLLIAMAAPPEVTTLDFSGTYIMVRFHGLAHRFAAHVNVCRRTSHSVTTRMSFFDSRALAGLSAR